MFDDELERQAINEQREGIADYYYDQDDDEDEDDNISDDPRD